MYGFKLKSPVRLSRLFPPRRTVNGLLPREGGDIKKEYLTEYGTNDYNVRRELPRTAIGNISPQTIHGMVIIPNRAKYM